MKFNPVSLKNLRRSMPGEKHPCAKLTDRQVRKIRESKETNKLLAERYGVSDRSISAIRLRQTWTHVA